MNLLATTRPSVHFTANAGWINDPLGLTWHDGRYHLFFQYLPGRTTWALDCRWGHATSSDLLHWSEQPVALAPGDGDDGVWSGSIATASDGTPRLFYTAVRSDEMPLGTVRTATPRDDDWLEWDKGPAVVDPARDHALAVARDPFVFRDGELWRMLVGAGLADGSGAALSYSSRDLSAWAPDGVAARRPGDQVQPIWTGTVWECPQLLRFPEADVLLVSVWHDDTLHDVVYSVGTYAHGRFGAGNWQQLTVGDGLYAASAFRDRNGEHALVFWIRGPGEEGTWAGAVSVPYRVVLEAGALQLSPHPELEQAWTETHTLQSTHRSQVGDQVYLEWAATEGSQLDLLAPSGQPVARLVRGSNGIDIQLGEHKQVRLAAGHQPVQIIADGPVLEICTGGQLFAGACLPVDAAAVSGGTALYRLPTTSTSTSTSTVVSPPSLSR